MDEKKSSVLRIQPFNKILSVDIVNGLHCCDREFICVCLSLFEDSLLHRKLLKLYDSHFGKTSKKLFAIFRLDKSDKVKLADSILKGKDEWFCSSFDDDTLRLILWVYLREAFSLDESISLSRRGIDKIADDLVAAIMLSTNKISMVRKVKNYIKDDNSGCDNITFHELCCRTLNELIESMQEKFKADENSDKEHEYVNKVKKKLKSLDLDMQEQLLKEIGAEEFNDQAIRTILLTTGGFTAFSASVGLSGFSAYILAAQASAFIPFVTGPGLVSFVSVLSNPVTAIAAIAGSAWWVTNSANTSIKQNVASLVSTLLSIQSVSSSKTDYHAISSIFIKVNQLVSYRDLTDDTIKRYNKLWANVKSAYKLNMPKMEHNLDDILSRPLDWNESQKGRLASLLFPDKNSSQNMVNLSLLSIGDVIYNMLAINPTVVNALDFSRADDISDALDFAGFAQSIMSMSPVSISGAINNLKGYVAEQFVAIELITQGHQVSFPDTSNQAGWDLLVDGEKFQVKCLSDLSGLKEHFSEYDFPVIANSELAGEISEDWADKVFFLDGFSNEFIMNLTDSSISNGASALSPDIPLFAFTLSAIENYKLYQRDKINMEQAVHQVMLDGTTKIGLATIGGFSGNTIGLLAFGPAGALVLGTTLPIIVQAQSKRVIGKANKYTDAYKAWAVKAQKVLNAFIESINLSINIKIDILQEKINDLGFGLLSNYMKIRFYEDIRYLCEIRSKVKLLSDESVDIERILFDVITLVGTSTIHPILYQRELEEIIKVMDNRPNLSDTTIESISNFAKKNK